MRTNCETKTDREAKKEAPNTEVDLTVKGRIVGVRLSDKGVVECVFQTEEIVDIRTDCGFLRMIYDKRKDGRYPVFQFDLPTSMGSDNVLEKLSFAYLLMERKELININVVHFEKMEGNKDCDTIHVSAGSCYVGYGFKVHKQNDNKESSDSKLMEKGDPQ